MNMTRKKPWESNGVRKAWKHVTNLEKCRFDMLQYCTCLWLSLVTSYELDRRECGGIWSYIDGRICFDCMCGDRVIVKVEAWANDEGCSRGEVRSGEVFRMCVKVQDGGWKWGAWALPSEQSFCRSSTKHGGSISALRWVPLIKSIISHCDHLELVIIIFILTCDLFHVS